MGFQFGNPIVGGVTLIRPAIQSPNYLATVAGWTINVDGSAEFNNVAIRGGLIEGAPGLYYNGTPAAHNLVASVSATSFTDSFGNVVLAGDATYHFVSAGPSGSLAIAINDGKVAWYSAATGTLGPWTQTAAFSSFNVVPGVFLSAPRFVFNSTADTNNYTPGHLVAAGTMTPTAPQTINSITNTPLAGCGPLNVGSQAYKIRAHVQYVGNQAAGTPGISIVLGSGAAATIQYGTGLYFPSGGTTVGTNARQSSLVFNGPTLTAVEWGVFIEAYANFTVGGTITLEALTSAAVDTYNVHNATLELIPV